MSCARCKLCVHTECTAGNATKCSSSNSLARSPAVRRGSLYVPNCTSYDQESYEKEVSNLVRKVAIVALRETQ